MAGSVDVILKSGKYIVTVVGGGGAGGENAAATGVAGGTAKAVTAQFTLMRSTKVTAVVGAGGLRKPNGGNGGYNGQTGARGYQGANGGGGAGGLRPCLCRPLHPAAWVGQNRPAGSGHPAHVHSHHHLRLCHYLLLRQAGVYHPAAGVPAF